MKNPVAFIIFNRPDTTQRVFDAIREAKPKKLFVIADGPRLNVPSDKDKCIKTRNIINQVDWDCEVIKRYSDTNLGCGLSPSSGISWVFDQVDKTIILEDDCLPDPSFFQFCDELLDKYENDERIMMISGTNILGEWKSQSQSYHFAYYSYIWGWASWKRAWNFYDFNLSKWSDPETKSFIKNLIDDEEQFLRLEKTFDSVANEGSKKSVWGYQWAFTRLMQGGLSVTPSKNLISNIGFSEDATHTKSLVAGVSNLEARTMQFPLVEPPDVIVDRAFDYRHNQMLRKKPFWKRLVNKIRILLKF